MTQRSDRPIVGHRPVVDRLLAAFEATLEGPQTALLHGPSGSGRATSADKLLERASESDRAFAQVRLRAQPGDDGLRTLMRAFGGFVAGVVRGGFGDADPGELLDEAASSSSDERVKGWLEQVAGNLRALRVHGGGGEFQIKLPRDNPWLALLYAWEVLGSRTSWIVDLHELGTITSPSFWVFLSALVGRARARNWRVLFVVAPGENLYSEKPDDESTPGPAAFLRALFADAELVEVPTLDTETVGELLEETYRPNDFPLDFTARLRELSGGHPDTVHELLDALEEDDTITWDDKGYSLSDLEDVDLDVLVPRPVEEGADADEDAEDGPPLKTLEQVLHVAAFEGQTFSASAIRTLLQAGEDEVDDALDAMPHVVEEEQYHQALGTWTYRFRYRFVQRWYRDNPPDGFRLKPSQVAAGLATVMMQSYAPAAFEYVPRAAALFTRAGDGRGARNLLAMAVGADRPELMRFALEIVDRFEDSPWPPSLLRLIHTRLADRGVNAAKVEDARAAIEQARAWAEGEADAGTLAWLQLLECRLAIRVGDFPEARRLGEAALSVFEGLGDKTRSGETLNQLAMVALNMADAKSADVYVRRATRATTIPPVKAHSLYIQGLLQKRRGQVQQAWRSFEQATKLSEQSGNLVLTLEAMLNTGECGIVVGRAKELAPLLERALEMSRALRSTSRERIAARLLCQAEAARGNGEAALEMARHALDLTREAGQGGESVDLYHCGLFAVLAGKKEEGLDFLVAARTAAEAEGNQGLMPEILLNTGQVRMALEDFEGGRGALEQGLALARERKDRVRELRALEHLGLLLSASGDHAGAAARFKEAAERALGPRSKQFRKELRRRMAQEQRLAKEAEKAARAAGPE